MPGGPLLIKSRIPGLCSARSCFGEIERHFTINDQPGHGRLREHLGSAWDVGFTGSSRRIYARPCGSCPGSPEPDLLRPGLLEGLPPRARGLAQSGDRDEPAEGLSRGQGLQPRAIQMCSTRSSSLRSSNCRWREIIPCNPATSTAQSRLRGSDVPERVRYTWTHPIPVHVRGCRACENTIRTTSCRPEDPGQLRKAQTPPDPGAIGYGAPGPRPITARDPEPTPMSRSSRDISLSWRYEYARVFSRCASSTTPETPKSQVLKR